VARAEAYLRAKFHLDPSNRLVTIHQRHRHTGQTDKRSDSIGRTVLQTVAQKERHRERERRDRDKGGKGGVRGICFNRLANFGL